MTDVEAIARGLADCWAGEIAGVAYYHALGERFPDHRSEMNVLALVEETTRDLIAPVARARGLPVDSDRAERGGVQASKWGDDWLDAMRQALAAAPPALRMYSALTAVLPDEEAELGRAVVEHELAAIAWLESAICGDLDWSAIDAYLERHGSRRP